MVKNIGVFGKKKRKERKREKNLSGENHLYLAGILSAVFRKVKSLLQAN